MFYVIMHHMSCSVHSNKMWILRSRSSNFLSLLLRVLKSTQVLNTDHFSSIYLSFPFFVEVVNIGINHGAIFHNGKLLGFWWLVTVSKYLILNPSKYLVQEWEQLKPWVYTSRPTSKHFVSYCRERCRKTIRLRPLTGQTTVCVCSSRPSAEPTGLARELTHDHSEWSSSAWPLGPTSKSDSPLKETGLPCDIWHTVCQVCNCSGFTCPGTGGCRGGICKERLGCLVCDTGIFSGIQQIHHRARLSPTSQDCGASGKMYLRQGKILPVTEKEAVRVVEVRETVRRNLVNTKVRESGEGRGVPGTTAERSW